MSASQPAYFNLQEFADLGAPLAGGRLYTYTQGTTALKTAYTDAAGAIPQTYTADGLGGQYIALNARGELPSPLYLAAGSYDISLKRADGSTAWTRRADPTGDGMAALALNSGAALIGYSAIAAAVAGTIGAHFKGEINITDFPWLCKCDSNGTAGNGTDDSAGFWAAVAWAKSRGYAIYHPGGVCRITYGFTQNVAYHNILFRGNGRLSEPYQSTSGGSTVMLDSTDPASYFLLIAANSMLSAKGIAFRCAQAVVDRPFFKAGATAGQHYQLFDEVNFYSVERPFVYAAGSYFQCASYRNVQFSEFSGTFHSETPNLVGTLMILDNVNHEGAAPASNTEKIICNLQGIRQIVWTNFLLEGSLPTAGWGILKLRNDNDANYIRSLFVTGNNFHSEWSVNNPAWVIDQNAGTVDISSLTGITIASPWKLSNMAHAIVRNTAFAGTPDEPSLMFTKDTGQCVVDFVNCGARTIDMAKPGFNHHNTQYLNATNGFGQVVISNDIAQQIYRWTGGYVPADGVAEQAYTGSVYPSSDASYGRKLVMVPAAGALNYVIRLNPAAITGLVVGDQVVVAVKAKLPTFAAGVWSFNLSINYAGIATLNLDSSNSGQVVDVLIPFVLTADLSPIAINFSNGTTIGAIGNLEMYSAAIYHGNSVPRKQVPQYPTNIISYATAAPALGSWVKGDRIINSSPAVGAAKAWTCTVTGTPGTWVSEGNL
jgi:hypothetical protein